MTIGNTAWPHLLADITAKRDALTGMIETIRTHFVNDSDPLTMPESPIVRPSRVERNHRPKNSTRKKSGLKGRRTDGRTEQGSGQRAARSRPSDDPQNAILATLRNESPQSPGTIAKTLRVSVSTLRYQLQPLVKSGAVVVTGVTMNRQVSLAGKTRPKEVP